MTRKLDDSIREKLAAVSQEEDETEETENDRQFAESVSSFGRKTSPSPPPSLSLSLSPYLPPASHFKFFFFLVEKFQSRSVPTPVSVLRYIYDPSYQHEDFTLTSACTLRARVSNQLILCCVGYRIQNLHSALF